MCLQTVLRRLCLSFNCTKAQKTNKRELLSKSCIFYAEKVFPKLEVDLAVMHGTEATFVCVGVCECYVCVPICVALSWIKTMADLDYRGTM